MGRDRKPSVNQETRITFPLPRRASLASSFSLPSLSLSTRSKPTPSLAPLDTTRANGNPLDGESSSSSYITPSVSHPDPSDSEPTRPVSPLKPPSSPGTSVPLPSIRSLRSRFSFSSHDTPNLPSTAVQTPTNKRVTSRRFLPFGNSTPTNQPPNNTPAIPRKSLGDVFALGRASTSSRFDSASSRSVTPSGRSSRSVTSAATMRGPSGWSHNSGLAPPNIGASSRPRSDDFSSLSADLGYVIAIGSDEETIRRRPDLPPAEPPPYLLDPSQTVDESSQEDITLSTLGDTSTATALSRRQVILPPLGVVDIGPSNSNATNQHATFSDVSTSRVRQSPVPPIFIPSLPTTGDAVHLERVDAAEKTPETEIELDAENLDALPTDFPFTPVDDRSDVASSTSHTPHSGNRSLRKNSHNIPPPLPSPSPRTGTVYLNALSSSSGPLSSLANARKGSSGASSANFSSVLGSDLPLDSLRDGSRLGEHSLTSAGRLPGNPAQILQVDPLHGVPGPASGLSSTRVDLGSKAPQSSALGLVEAESRSALPSISKSELPTGPSAQRDRLGELLSSLSASMLSTDLSAASLVQDSDRSGVIGMGQQSRKASGHSNGSAEAALQSGQDRRPSGGDPGQNAKHLGTFDDDLARLLSPHRFSPLPSLLTPESSNALDKPRQAVSTHPSLPPAPPTPQAQSSPLHRPGSRLQQNVSTPSPSGAPFRSNDLLSVRAPGNVQRAGSIDRNAVSLNNTPLLSPKKLVDQPYQRELATTPNNPSRPVLGRSPSVSAAMTRKRSASFDFSGSTTFGQDLNDPFTAHSNGPKRADWLGPKTAKAFAAAGLLDKDKERSGLHSNVRSETPVHRGALDAWRSHSGRNGFGAGPGSVRSHSRLGSEIISPSFRSRSLAGGDSSPGYGRASLDLTAPPSPVSTHRTLVSNATSSSQSQQSALQTLRERHELETEALLLALAGSKRAERDLRAENEELSTYIVQLERRIAMLEAEKEQQDRSKSRARDRHWNTPSSSDVEVLDKRRQDIVAGRLSTRGWGGNATKSALPNNRPTAYGTNRPLLLPNETPRSASAASVRRSSEDVHSRSSTPSKYWSSVDVAGHSPVAPLSRARTPSGAGTAAASEPPVRTPETEFEEWNESSFGQPLQSSPRADARNRLSSHSVISLLPQMPGSMSMLVHEQPGGESFEEDAISFGSASPSSLTLVHPRSNTPKPVPANISPITAEFSFNSIPGSPRSLRLRPEEEMHLADLISLQGLEITDVVTNLDG